MLLGRLSTAVMRASSCAHASAPLSAFEVSYANQHTNVLFYYSGQVRKIVLNFNSIEDRMSVDAWTNLGDVLEELYLGDCRFYRHCTCMGDCPFSGNCTWETVGSTDTVLAWETVHPPGTVPGRLSVLQTLYLHGRLSILRELYLGDCRLKELPAGMFDHMHQLRYLHLWKNQISVIPSKFFQVRYFIE